jgi:two-component system, NtrC family, sensor kinase
MRSSSLHFRVVLYLTVALTVAMALLTVPVIRHQREELLAETANHVARLSDVITRSTRFAMLLNQPAYVERILQDVGKQEGIAKVRIFSKQGRIIHSTYLLETGQTVDRNAEGCFHCHQGEKPLLQIPTANRARIFSTGDGKRLLGIMDVIRNEPSCAATTCHESPAAQPVLGVLDIVYSLEEIDRTVRRNTIAMVAFALGFVIVAAFCANFLVHRLVYRPLRDLEAGAKRISAGDLEHPIPVRGSNEFVELAASFNAMTAALRESRQELRDWAHTLEEKVEERTQKLRAAELGAARREKLASVGLLAAGIAHELNSPLTGILTFSSLLRKKIAEGSQDAEDLDLVIRETKRCSTIIRRLLDFAREKTPEKKYADLNRIIEEAVRIVERPAHLRDIEIVLDLAPDLRPIWIDEDLIKQVIVNIVVNAQHAIEDQGHIIIRSRLCPEPRSPEPGAQAVPMVEVAIVDNGCGMPAQNLQRIFDPFFTTKGVGQGTGLGLSVSHGIVKAHGGAIEVESALGEGSTFRVYLPTEPPAGETGNGAGSGSNA